MIIEYWGMQARSRVLCYSKLDEIDELVLAAAKASTSTVKLICLREVVLRVSMESARSQMETSISYL
jgi:hypothetical protein